jgi:ABC-type antimicrobial peptide transport system permease subunit
MPDTFLTFMNSLMPINWLIRVSGDPLTVARTVHSDLLTVDGGLVASHPRPLTEVLRGSLSQSRLEASIVGFFSGAALLLGAIGLYALLAYSVNERKREIGIRLALGADQAQILRLIIVQDLKLTVTGICIGVAIGLALSRFMNSLLFGVGATDPLTFTVVVAVLILVAITACYVPAYRAMQVDPIFALRYE